MKPILFILAALATGVLACEKSTIIGRPGSGGSGAGTGGGSGGSGAGTGGGSGGSGAGTGGATAVPMAMGTGGGSGGSAAGTGGTGGGLDEAGGATGAGSGGTTGSGGADGGSTGSGGAGGAAENRIVLYDGSAATFNGWAQGRYPDRANPWRNNADMTMTVITGTGDIQSKMKFQDLFVHVEYMTPVFEASDPNAMGLNRGNSGVFLKGSYEMQILDTYGQAPAIDGCGAVTGVSAPLETACFMGGQWNTYEIEFKANVCDAAGTKTANARIVKATLNGRTVQQDVQVPTMTSRGQAETCSPAGLLLEERGSFKPVIYRNIWVIPRNSGTSPSR